MKKLLIALLMLTIPAAVNAGVSKSGAGLMDSVFSNGVATRYKLGTNLFEGAVQVSKGVYNFSTDGGSCGKINLDVDIPDNALIKRVFYIVETKPTIVGSPTISLGASTGTRNTEMLSAADPNAMYQGGLYNGTPQNTLATMVELGASTTREGWPLKMVIKDSAGKEASSTQFLSAGKIVFFVEYVITE